ncbi:hypothetical protein Drorol1_Dr00010131 [Drosera rotundifolia]
MCAWNKIFMYVDVPTRDGSFYRLVYLDYHLCHVVSKSSSSTVHRAIAIFWQNSQKETVQQPCHFSQSFCLSHFPCHFRTKMAADLAAFISLCFTSLCLSSSSPKSIRFNPLVIATI